VQIFTPEGDFLRKWTHIGMAYNISLNQDSLWVNVGKRIVKVDLTGKIIGWIEAGGHGFGMAPNGDIIIARHDGPPQLYTKD
jgi:hypothetical protein